MSVLTGRPTCHYCGRQIVPPMTLYQRQCGWAKLRGSGGTNALKHRKSQDSYACGQCLRLLDSGIDPRTQPSLG